MAEGQFRLYHAAVPKLGNGTVDVDSHVLKWALLTDAVTPDAADPNPCFGAGGATNVAASECTPGGLYPAGGVALTGVSYAESGGLTTFDSDDLALALHPSNPQNARWLVIYDDTAPAKDALGFADLAGLSDLSRGAFEWIVPPYGWFYFLRGVE